MSTDRSSRGYPAEVRSARRQRRQQRVVRTVTILLLLTGVGGFAVAHVVDSSVAKNAAENERALGQQDPAVAAGLLRSRVTPVKGAYDSYAAASLATAAARRDVITLLNQAKPPSTSGSQPDAGAMDELPRSIAAYGAAVERENVARQAYTRQLALLMTAVHR